ncbi:MAG TPA: AMP-binding protein [Acidimicrobiia bacterium]|nr:AMP-binding protein [Acidimicrobiia bacterium]
MSLVDLLDGDDADVVAIAGAASSTRGEVRALADTLADQLQAYDVAGRAVGVRMPNTAAAIAAWFAVWRSGAAFVPLNPRVPDAEIERLVETTGVVVIVEAGSPYTVRPVTPIQARRIEEQQAIIQFTSGTTGLPKAVPLRHDTVGELLDGVIGELRSGRADRPKMPNIVPVSLSLWAGIYQVLFAWKLGVPVVLMERFAPREFARLVKQHEIRSSVLPPAALVMLMQDDTITTLKPLRYVRSVSAPLSPAAARRFHERFGIAVLNGYGQTELGGEAVGWTAADWKQFGNEKLGSVGRPHAAFSLRVNDDDELEIKSSHALPPADAAMEGRVTADGWLRTGDLARIDDDGFVWIEGRVSDMINRGGLKVFPDDVEEQLRAFPGVLDVGVAGVADERLGEVPWAFVVPRANAYIDAGELRRWAHDRMAPYKVPVGVTVVDDLPRNEIGKLMRAELVRRYS